MLFFNAISVANLSMKIKNSLEWLLVMKVTKESGIVKNRKGISKMEDA
ncbi:hypothetical protein yfred0001_11430 [Yersinia frederiksenii ATCC 33641]|nr:hypothetical protein yfred0001_11430 [Yersinia frederiksenii ATCC 33641]